jgi:alanine dehydrogenase
MDVGVVREVKPDERRVALTPSGAQELTRRGHRTLVEAGAGSGAGFADECYLGAGAEIVGNAQAIWSEAELLLKVKEPMPQEYGLLRPDLTLFTYLHLAAVPELITALVDSGSTAIAYEAVQLDDGRLPLLAPMSEVAGRLAPQVGANALLAPSGGMGRLIGPVPGVAPAQVAVIGGGVVGYHAAKVALGMGAQVIVLERSPDRLRRLEEIFGTGVQLRMSTEASVTNAIAESDLVIGCVLVPNARAPQILSRHALAGMRPGSVLVDVAIDQGGCFETSRPTTHAEPTYQVDGIIHYCVANMPGAVPVTSTQALTDATLPYVLELAGKGVDAALECDRALGRGLCVRAHRITNDVIAAANYLHHLAAA